MHSNILYSVPNVAFDVHGSIAWTYNTFFGAGISSFPSGTGNAVQDPLFVSVGTGSFGRGSALGYKLSALSPSRNAAAMSAGDYVGWTSPSIQRDQGAFSYNDGSTVSSPSTPASLTGVSGHPKPAR
jgi:hypothetical protein